jgi:hypothetical protein
LTYVLASEVDLSPILVRPVREQLEHDRVIRLLQAKYKRKFDVGTNPGNEQTAPVGTGPSAWFPDVVLYSADRNRKLAGVVEVETTESVNNLEAMSQWAAFGRFGVPFHLYLPTGSIDSGRRFCTDLGVQVAEIWAYQSVGEQVRFTLVHRVAQAGEPAEEAEEVQAGSARRAAAPPRRRAAAPARPAAPAKPAARRAGAGAASAGRSRPNGKAASRPSRASTAATSRRTTAKAKTAARRPAAKTARKAVKTTRASRAAKRR